MINNWFAAKSSLELIDNSKHIEQTTSLSAYIDTFEELMGKTRMRNPTLTKD
jgi:hypothetical protein